MDKELTIVERAYNFAENKHRSQRYGSHDLPYTTHLTDVYRVLRSFGVMDDGALAAAYLHDILEDTPTSYNDLKHEFGLVVAELVYAVTDELGRNRKERHQKTYPKIANYPLAINLKLADRIANVSYSIGSKDPLMVKMYSDEYPDFRAALKQHGGLKSMWDGLDSLLDYKDEFEGYFKT